MRVRFYPSRFKFWLARGLMRKALKLTGFDDVKETIHGCGWGGCGYVEPYGFVPECGCPVHDPDSHDYSFEGDPDDHFDVIWEYWDAGWTPIPPTVFED